MTETDINMTMKFVDNGFFIISTNPIESAKAVEATD